MMLPTLKLNIERWKFNKEYRVYVSNMGHFKNAEKQPLPIKLNQSGYCCIKTPCGYRMAHRIVMLTWRPIPDAENLTVDHLDHNKRNNSLDNLEWVTYKENQRRSKEDQLSFGAQGVKAEKISNDNKVLVNGVVYMTVEELYQFYRNMAGLKSMSNKQLKGMVKTIFHNKKTHWNGLTFKHTK